jgi:uncharacterized protein
MKVSFVIHTPGQANFWRYPILKLKERGHAVQVLSRDDKSTSNLLQSYNIPFKAYGKIIGGKTSRTPAEKIAKLPFHFLNSLYNLNKFKPDIVIGTGIIEAYSARILGKPCIIFEDTEVTPSIERNQWKYLASSIITPESFSKDLGKKQVRFAGYKEIAYLHPNYFSPDPTIYDELKINKDEKYVILRFNSLDAIHDIRRHGFTISDQFNLVKELEKYARVFISPERALPEELNKYRLSIPYHRIHHALYYAQLFVSDTGTASTEAAILGTPAIMLFSGKGIIGNFLELEQKYDLMYTYFQADEVLKKAIELIKQPDLKDLWANKRQKMLSDKIDVTGYIVNFIENYPEGINKIKINAHPITDSNG